MQVKDIYNKWLSYAGLDSSLKEILLNLNEDEINESFYKELEFGTGGLRGLMGPGTNRVNLYTIRKATKGLANYLIKNGTTSNGVAISYDNRLNSKEFAFDAARVLAANNIKTYVFENLRPTPMLSYAVRHFNCDAGIMVTASHNPKEYNGYKVYNNQGAQLNLDEADAVINEISKVTDLFTIETKDDTNLINIIKEDFDEIYLNEVKNIRINTSTTSIKAVYSPLHGTGGTVIPKFLKAEGYDIYELESQMIVDSSFKNTLSSNPEESASYIESIKYAKQIDAELVLVTDPDADRLGISVKHDGEFINLNGNQTASLMLYYILNEKTKNGTLASNGAVFTTIVTTDLIKDIAKSFNMKIISTLTGFKFIGQQAELTKGKYTYVFGSEESYGSLVSDFVRDKDAVQAVYLLVEIASFLKEQGLTIIDYLNEIYTKYGIYYEFTENVALSGIEGSKKIQETMEFARNNIIEVPGYKFLGSDDFNLQTYFEPTEIELPKSNVIKYYYSNNLTAILRPSGTEPKLKIYYSIKGTSLSTLEEEIKTINKNILKTLSL